ncbi:chromate transporter, chromate ion transporter family protein, partial [Vibrio parahaemolyticus 861]
CSLLIRQLLNPDKLRVLKYECPFSQLSLMILEG